MDGKRAVTLVELAIVITVFIVIFISLTPLVNKMRDRANMIKCSNNIRLISIALHTYAADHNEEFAPDLRSLYPDYIKEEKVFRCPSAKTAGTAEKCDYEYVAGLTESSPPAKTIVYDRGGNHKKKGRNILRVNGSVEWVENA